MRSFGVRNIIYYIPKAAKECWDRSACSLSYNVWEMPPWVLIFLFSAYRDKRCSLFLFIFGESSRGRRNSFGIFWRGQKYNLAFVWWRCGKFQFPHICAGRSKLNFAAWFLGPGPRGGDAWQRATLESQCVSHVRKCRSTSHPSLSLQGHGLQQQKRTCLSALQIQTKENTLKDRNPFQPVYSFSTAGGGGTETGVGSWVPEPSGLHCWLAPCPLPVSPPVSSSVKWGQLSSYLKGCCEKYLYEMIYMKTTSYLARTKQILVIAIIRFVTEVYLIIHSNKLKMCVCDHMHPCEN